MRPLRLADLAVSLALILVTGCSCGDDYQDAPTIEATPPAGLFREAPEVTLTANEDATIYYTVDGSVPSSGSDSGTSPVVLQLDGAATVRFFAVDEADNEGAEGSAEYAIDRLGPPTVVAMRATPDEASGDVDLEWTNPSAKGFATVVLVRTEDVADTFPTAREGVPEVGDAIGAGDVVYVGADGAFTDVAPGPGLHTYVAWAFYDTGEFSEGRVVNGRIRPAAQTCAMTIDMLAGTPEVVIDTQPSHFTLTASNVAVVGNNVTFDLAVTSHLAGAVFNPKLVFGAATGTPSTTIDTASDGDVDVGDGAQEYRDLGPVTLVPGVARTRSVSIDTGEPTIITIECQIAESVAVYGNNWNCDGDDESVIADLDTGFIRGGLPLPIRTGGTGAKQARPTPCHHWRGMVLSPEGRYLYLSSRTGNQLVKVDTSSLEIVQGIEADASATQAAIAGIELDPSGRRIYATFNDGGHGGQNSHATLDDRPDESTISLTNDIFLLEVDAGAMTETGRLLISSGDWLRRASRLSLDADGRRAGLATGPPYAATHSSEIRMFDLSAWAPIDADIDLGDLRPTSTAFSADGDFLVFNAAGDSPDVNLVGIVDLADLSVTTASSDEPLGSGSKILNFVTNPDGSIWLLGSTTGLKLLDPATATISTIGTAALPGRTCAGLVDPEGKLVVAASSNLTVLDVTSGTIESTIDVGGSNNHHDVVISPF